jgi:catechol 2,3-dioxygenase-like lactoylglutathione lyase family enzyme
MFDHVKFGVSDYAASKAFFLKALGRRPRLR